MDIQLDGTGLTSYTMPGFDCAAGTPCAPGAVYQPGGNGVNITGCTKVNSSTCSGTCKYCSGGGAGSICVNKEHADCVVGATALITCGTKVEYDCIWAASPPTTPGGQPVATDNGCYCGVSPGKSTTEACQFAACT